MSGKLAVKGGASVRGGKTFPAWPQHGQGEREALLRVLDSNVWGVGGKETERFERTFADYQGCRHCVSMTNGTVTLRNALMACGLEEGSEVIVPPYTFLATATAVVEANCVPVFVDIEPDTYCISPRAIEAAITNRTRAVIPVHLGGHPARMDEIMAIAAKHNLRVIEDCAHAHGSEYRGKRVGSLGHIGSFSFQSSKNLCCGEGGAVVTNDEGLADRCWSIHNCGRTRSGAWYEHVAIGGNYRLSQFQAAILNEQIKKLDGEIETRQRNAAYLDTELAKIPGIKPLVRQKEVTRHSYHLYIFRYDSQVFGGIPRKVFIEALRAEGVPAGEGYAVPLHKQPLFVERNLRPFHASRGAGAVDYSTVSCEVAERAGYEEGCWFSQSVLLGGQDDMREIVDAFAKLYEHRSELG